MDISQIWHRCHLVVMQPCKTTSKVGHYKKNKNDCKLMHTKTDSDFSTVTVANQLLVLPRELTPSSMGKEGCKLQRNKMHLCRVPPTFSTA